MRITIDVRVSRECTAPTVKVALATSHEDDHQLCRTLDVILGLVPRIYSRRVKSICCRSSGQARG
ncbi:hypothetical protein AGR7A_Cc180004 [Agrobacterium deltaense NCPPB 1641]|uniref:Uncharacterized protein n=1 Tax=Agrobacterium deltaense NCPPB 1641 TaxID=1183425 RepID=A0A1S7TKH2_9HYPH|nr:hypothetical protein AGR7A_Cc180004 [Agrobacterium deltaense NCPPB 1641]